jgi:DNA polymerase I-like protein with 3'-5' exonuclease and polymerase domains
MKGSLLTTQEEVGTLARHLQRVRAVAIDTEATGLDTFRGDVIRGMSLSYRLDGEDDLRSYYVSISHPDSPNLNPAPLIDALKRTDALHIGHNWSYDWSTLTQIGYEPRWGYEGAYYDTETVAWLTNENIKSRLKYQGALHFGEDEDAEQRHLKEVMAGHKSAYYYDQVKPGVRKGKLRIAQQWARERSAASKKTWATLTAEDEAEYAAQDTDITYRLWELQLKWDHGDTDPTVDIEREFRVRETTYRMMREGVRVNIGRVEQLKAEYEKKRDEIASEFDINLASPKQLQKLIFGAWGLPILSYTPGGDPSTDRDTLEQLEGLHPGLDRILEYRHYAKMIGTYLDNFLRMADDNDRIHSSINVTGTVTGRFSSSKPNLQNIPTEAKDNTVKTLFLPRPGYELIEVDLKSAELFVGAAISHDDDMIGVLQTEGIDFHTITAERIFGTSTGDRRRLAKNVNYGLPYGLGAPGLAAYMVKGTGNPVTREVMAEAGRIIDGWKKAWPATGRTIRRLTDFADKYGYIPLTQPGRFRHHRAPGITVPGYTAFNSVVQGGVAEVVKSWMLVLEAMLVEIGAIIVLQVHDSLWIEVPIGMSAKVIELAQLALDEVNPYYVRLLIDAKRLDKAMEG